MEEKANILNIYQTGFWIDIHYRQILRPILHRDELEIEHIAVLEKDIDHRKVIAHE